MPFLDVRAHPWLWSAVGLALGVAAGLAAYALLYAVLARVARRTGSALDDAFVRRTRRPVRVLFPLLGLSFAFDMPTLGGAWVPPVRHGLELALIGAMAWLLVALVNVSVDVVASRYRMDVADNLQARRVRTQLDLLRRIVVSAVAVVALALALMTFPAIRNLGISLFASAGVAGLVIGIAARPALSNIIGGIQLALTEPIRIDDVVIVQNEWGRIEEITTTYVVVRIWDDRRLVVPLSWFIENPFQNWTRTTSNLLGTVFLYVDYTVPVEEVRAELERIVKGSDLWDGRAWALQVTDATDRTVELRALMSAANAGSAFDLRCLVRERLIAFLQRQHPGALPRVRADVREGDAGPPSRAAPAGPPAGP